MHNLYERLYLKITDASEDDIDSANDGVAKNAPKNFFHLIMARAGSKIADRLANPKTTLAWILQTLGAPSIFTGLIVPLRESGSLLLQVIISNYLKRYSVRKWAWSLGAIIQGIAIAGCGIVALTLEGTAAGVAIVSLVALFSLARSISSVAAKDILGKTIPKRKRGQLTGWAGSASGIITIAAAAFLIGSPDASEPMTKYAAFLFGAAFLWWGAAFINSTLIEKEGKTEKPEGLFKGVKSQFALLRDDVAFRDFVIVRSFAIGSGLSTPYIISLAHNQFSGKTYWLGIFIIAEGLAATTTSPFWGKWADQSSRNVMRGAMFIVAALLTSVLGFTHFFESSDLNAFVFPVILFLLGAAHTGVRVGRKTYIVDMADGNKRTDYVAIGNTIIGVILLIGGLLTGIASLVSIELSLAIFATCALIGGIYGSKLPVVNS